MPDKPKPIPTTTDFPITARNLSGFQSGSGFQTGKMDALKIRSARAIRYHEPAAILPTPDTPRKPSHTPYKMDAAPLAKEVGDPDHVLSNMADNISRSIFQLTDAAAFQITIRPRTAGFPVSALVCSGDETLQDALSNYTALCFGNATISEESSQPARAHSGIRDGHLIIAHPLSDESDAMIGALSMAYPSGSRPLDERMNEAQSVARLIAQTLIEMRRSHALEIDRDAAVRRADNLARRAELDPLTTLYNATTFENKVREMVEDRRTPFAFIMIDVDNLRAVNELYGHQFGDLYLKAIAHSLRSTCPTPAVIGRLGGDEFCIALPLSPGADTYLNARLSRIRSAIQRGAAMLGKSDLGRVSIGASLYPKQAERFTVLFELADTALYASKHAGKPSYTVFSSNHHERFNNRSMHQRFDLAVKNQLIEPFFQPIVALETGVITGFEVLARWRDPHCGVLSPAAFEAVFKDHHMAQQLTRLIMRRAFEAYQAAGLTGSGIKISLNLTTFDLMCAEFVFDLQALLGDFGMDWSVLILEVTEKVMLDEPTGQLFRSLEEMHLRGATIALDDFGTGYGGLRHLTHWPVDLLKIDRFFVSTLGDNLRDRAIPEAIISIARNCGLSIVAEGIETPEQMRILQGMGCSKGQGFLFAPPMPATELSRISPRYDLDRL
ncbi:bifunctional diguanylate cyclase/phosphodiesterase [Rhodobacteraceae bacterium]|nr:bifunctional diguanylate cyclase/phosphodiesterase [Paracoccaceae bacterium]